MRHRIQPGLQLELFALRMAVAEIKQALLQGQNAQAALSGAWGPCSHLWTVSMNPEKGWDRRG